MKNPAAEFVAKADAVKRALYLISTLKLMAGYCPYDGCPENFSSYDYIIVGGGTSGCVIANRLSEDRDVTVLLIEAGDNIPIESSFPSLLLLTKDTHFDWNFTDVTGKMYCHQKNNGITFAGKVLGGTSSVDHMLHSQGFSCDYDGWAKICNDPAWRFANIQRLLKRVERLNDREIANSPNRIYHGFKGNVGLTKYRTAHSKKFLNVFREAGHNIVQDINDRHRTGYTESIFYIDDNLRQSSAQAYAYPAKHRSNLVVVKKMQVIQIMFDECKKAVGVKAVDTNTHKEFIFNAKREVIVAAGTFNTAKLLQLSGIGPCKLLKKLDIKVISDLPVGENYHNQIATPIVHAIEKTSKPYIPEDFDPFKFVVPTVEGYIALNKSHSHPDYRTVTYILLDSPCTSMLQYCSVFYSFHCDVVNAWVEQSHGREALFTLVINPKPVSRGSVQIQSKNPFEPILINASYYLDDVDMKNTIKYVKNYLQLEKGNYFKKAGGFFVDPKLRKCGKYNPDCDEYWRCYIRCLMAPLGHQCGTAALGSVVDGRLRVYGVHGLRVADGSIMPSVVTGSTTIPIMAIGENVADMIKQDRKHKKCA